MRVTARRWRDWAATNGAGPVLAVLVVIAFAPSLAGPPFWDDLKLVAAADALRRFCDAFLPHSFGLRDVANAQGADFWRPLVTASLWSEGRVAAMLGMHATPLRHLAQCLWHAAGAWLVWRLLVRLAPADPPRRWWNTAAWWAALAWAVVPLKVENVTWLSGRGDVMGWTLLLVGAELALRFRRWGARALLAAASTGLALLCKEVWIVAPLLWSLLTSRRDGDRRFGSPELWGSLASVAAYAVVRVTIIGVARGGGEPMFAALGPVERLSVPFETLGQAIFALMTPWSPRLLRGPWAFEAPQVLVPDAWAGGVGLVALLVACVVAFKVERFRAPLLLVTAPLLPVLNLVPTGLEARMSDRYLYVPLLGVLLGLLLVVPVAPPAWFVTPGARRWVLAIASALLLVLLPQPRIRQFTHPAELWAAESARSEPAASILIQNAHALEQAGQLRSARDAFLRAAERYSELGFAEGLPLAISAVRLETRAAGETARAMHAYANALRCVRLGTPESVGVPFADGGGVRIPCQTSEAALMRANRSALLDSEIARAERGLPSQR